MDDPNGLVGCCPCDPCDGGDGGGPGEPPVDEGVIPDFLECFEGALTGIEDGDRMRFYFGDPKDYLGISCSPDYDVIYSGSK